MLNKKEIISSIKKVKEVFVWTNLYCDQEGVPHDGCYIKVVKKDIIDNVRLAGQTYYNAHIYYDSLYLN